MQFDPLPHLLAQAEKPAAPPAPPAKPAAEIQSGPQGAVVEEGKAGPQGQGQGGVSDYLTMFGPFILIAVVFYMIVLRPQRSEQRNRDEMLKNLKKNDRVLTIGGIIGTVANITPDGKEVTLKIDDNARMHVVRSAIQTVLTGETKPGDVKPPA